MALTASTPELPNFVAHLRSRIHETAHAHAHGMSKHRELERADATYTLQMRGSRFS
jgi:hypothetical protein